MAARAQVARDYPFGSAASRPRRDVYFRREDPVVLPRSRDFTLDFRLLGAALAATALVTAATYAVFSAEPPALGPTSELPLTREWTPGSELGQAAMLKALAGPALATRSLTATENDAASGDSAPVAQESMPQSSVPQSMAPLSNVPHSAPDSSSSESPRAQDLVPELPAMPEVYPNPTSTPPDGIAPPEASPEAPTPSLDPENPYR